MVSKLSDRDRAVLNVARLDCRKSASEIAQEVGIKPETVRRILRNLRERNIISPMLLINPNALGLTDYCFYLNAQGGGKEELADLIQFAQNSPAVAYFAELSGEYNYTFSLLSASVFEIEDFLRGLENILPDVSLAPIFSIRLSWSLFSLKHKETRGVLERGRIEKEVVIDQNDHNILVALSESPDASFLAVGRRSSLPTSTVAFRVNRLLEKGVISGFPYYIKSSASGEIPFRALVQSSTRAPTFYERFKAFTMSEGCVDAIVYCLGPWNLEVNFSVNDVSEASQFVNRLRAELSPHISSIVTINEIAVHKSVRYPEGIFHV